MDVKTYGCAVNQADSEIIMGLLREHGLDNADVTVVNTCTVKSPTENKIMKELRRLSGEGLKVVVAGCLPPVKPKMLTEFPGFSFIGVNTHDIARAVSVAACGERYVKIADSYDKSCMPRVRLNPVVGIVPIARGCLGGCSYCQTKNARGGLRSYPMDRLVSEVESMVDSGVREVWITAQDTGAYGRDVGSSLPELLRKIVDVEGDYIVRVGMMNPDHALDMVDELMVVFESQRLYRFLHLPVQSGDDKVLEDMGRRYTVDEFKEVVGKFDGFTISTDVIVGYPTEDEEGFRNTVRLIEEVKPDIVNISRYWPRPGTKASELKGHPGRETKRRSRIMNELFRKVGLEKNNRWVGWSGRALVSELNDDGTATARNRWYKPIVVPYAGLGEEVEVNVTGCTYYDLRAQLP